jgi:hypothetical protein
VPLHSAFLQLLIVFYNDWILSTIITNIVGSLEKAVMSDPIDSILLLPQRKLIVAQSDVCLDRNEKNYIFILMVEESRGTAGGRAAGSGHRRIQRIYGFACDGGTCIKFFESGDRDKVDKFDIPYSAVAMDVKLSDGRPYVVQGIVDPDFVTSYRSVISNLK